MNRAALQSRLGRWCLVSALLLASAQSHAAAFSFTGTFSQDDDIFLIPFTLGADQNVTLRTLSYAGGTNAAGALVPAGGFDPILSLFTSAGSLVAVSDDDGVATDPTSGNAYDSLLDLALGAGSYILALTQYDNFPNGFDLADGFSSVFGPGNFTPALAADAGNACPAPQFCDDGGFARTGNYAVDLIDVSAVPEPSSLALLALGLAGWAASRRRAQA